MKRTVSALLLLTLLLLLLPVIKPYAKAPAQDTAASDVRIMSANVLAEFASWSGGTAPEATSSRVVKLNKMLEENAPIAVGTQEMSPSWYTAFKKLDTTKWGWLEESDVAGYSYYNFVPNKGLALNSILYRKDLLTLNAHGVEAYSSRSNGQCIVWAVFTIQSSGKQFVMISTHWTPGADKANERLAQAEQLAKKVNSLRNTYGNTVICTGDFNCNDQTQEFRRFLLNSNSVDSRTGAASRGDHLNKIDHVTATGDASFSYHTICYEANGSYAISDHPFAVADVKVSSALLFDYTDSADSRAHYKQGNYRFNAYDYHEAYWVYDPALVSNRTINKADGTLTFRASSSGDPYIMTATNNTTDPKTAYGLNFRLAEAEYARVKFRLTDCQLIDSAVTPSVTVGATNTSVGKWATDRKTYNFSKASSTYVSLYIPLTSSGVKSLSRLDSVRITFDNIKNGTVTIDSIYIGKDPSAPLSKALFFDYSNTTADQSRYGGTSYGGYNFDKGNWTTAGYGATKDFALNNTEGTVAVKVKNTNDLGPVFATAPATGTYSWDTSGACLSYDPAKAEVMQIRFKLDGCQTVSGKNARVLLMYGGMYNGVFDGNNYENVKEYTYTDGQYLILTMALSDLFRQADQITQVGVRFQYIASSAGGTAILDYLYIGPERALPTKHVYDHKVTKPTCTAQGYTTHTCRTCAYSYRDTYVSQTAHTEVIDKAVAATCTATGKTEGKHCSVCNTVIVAQQTVPAKGHTEVVDKAVAATCIAAGKTEGKHCSVCNTVIVAQQTVPAKGHTEVVDKAVAATCTAAGKTEGKHCSVCSAILVAQQTIPAKGHTEVVDKAVAATCTATGKTEGKHCSVCSAVLVAQQTIPAKGHTEVVDKAVAATCTATGKTEGKHCSVCNTVIVAQQTVPAKGHTEVVDKAVAATCIAAGKTEGKHCSVCNTVIVAQQTIPAKGHTEVVDKAVAATCTATGKTEGKHCSVCNTVIVAQQTVPAKGHTEAVDKAVAATCTATGKTAGKHCSVCNAVLVAQEAVPAKGHSYTYTTLDGQTHSVGCQNCDLSETASHSYENGTCICGEPEIKDPVEDISLKLNHSLNLASDISVNLVVPKTLLNGFDMKTVYVESTLETYVGNEKTGVQIIRMEPVDNGYFYYFTLDGLTAVQMNDRISSVLYGTKDGQPYYSPVDEYSIATYAYAQLNKTGIADSLKTLCADLLRYGSKAQIFKSYRTDSLADANMTAVHKAYLSDMDAVTFGNTNAVLNDLPDAPITWAGKALNLESKVALKFVFNMGSFTGETDDLRLRISYEDAYGNEKTEIITNPEAYGQGTGAYVFSLDTLLAAELRTVVSAQIYAGDIPVSCTLQYSPDTYGNNKIGTLLDLCKALFAYSDSAKAYFA